MPEGGITITERIANRRNGALSDLELAGVDLTPEQSVALDQILNYQSLMCASTIGSLAKLAEADRAAVSRLMRSLPQSNVIVNYQKGLLR
jgi:hypothetical protein